MPEKEKIQKVIILSAIIVFIVISHVGNTLGKWLSIYRSNRSITYNNNEIYVIKVTILYYINII